MNTFSNASPLNEGLAGCDLIKIYIKYLFINNKYNKNHFFVLYFYLLLFDPYDLYNIKYIYRMKP